MSDSIKELLRRALVIMSMVSLVLFVGCKEEDSEEYTEEDVPKTEMDEYIRQMNQDIADMRQLADGKQRVLTYFEEADGNCVVELENGHILHLYSGIEEAAKKSIPILGINDEGYWVYRFYDTTQILPGMDDQPVAALSSTGKGIFTPKLRLNSKKYWEVSFNEIQWKQLGSQPAGKIESATQASYSPFSGFIADEKNKTITLLLRCGRESINSAVLGKGTTEAWNKFLAGTADNVLLDFSYAGYKHAEVAPSEASSLSYKVYNVKERMAAQNMTAREALISILQENNMTRKGDKNYANENARIIIYFPQGEYILHNDDDNVYTAGKPVLGNIGREDYSIDSKGNNTSSSIMIHGGHFVMKGDGPGKTKLIMDTPNLPSDINTMYSSPVMIDIKHNSGLSKLCNVTSEAAKGTFSVEVSDASLLKAGDWVCLYLQNNDPELVSKELKPYTLEATMGNIRDTGVQVRDYHQIVQKSGNRITFKEPIMHEVESRWGWEIHKYPHFEEVGVEDLTFVGRAAADFEHHRNWAHDGAYKPIKMMRLTNSWMRRVEFTSVSEANSIVDCANVSAYDIKINGNRGHAAIRSQGSSRVFIGKVTDRTNGPLVDNRSTMQQGAGQYHACGVSKPSMGAVIWRAHWGVDACFEAHATQPRATLIDNCAGGFMQSRQGGDADQVPNHLADLTIWNMYSENSPKPVGPGAGTDFDWWRTGWKYWKILPPVIVGFHGTSVNFVQGQVKLDESHGTPVEPQSLYEAQLKKRLGAVPAWLEALK